MLVASFRLASSTVIAERVIKYNEQQNETDPHVTDLLSGH